MGLGQQLRGMLARLVGFAKRPQPPPEDGQGRFLYGLAQPALAARILLADPPLLKQSIQPAVQLAVFCGLCAWLHIGGSDKSFLVRFYVTFTALAALPSVVFARRFARMAALVRNKLGFGPVLPKEEPLPTVILRAAAQAIVVALGVVPILAALKIVPVLGEALALGLAAFWALQWVVVDAFDDARVLRPGQTRRMLEREAEMAPRPWFVRFFKSLGDGLGDPLGKPARWFGGLLDRLSISVREECALVEKNPAVAAGFAATTAALLAIPVLNLFFRPIVLVSSAHLLGHLEKVEPHAPPELQPEAQPAPALKLTP
jgi:hypothetical protein